MTKSVEIEIFLHLDKNFVNIKKTKDIKLTGRNGRKIICGLNLSREFKKFLLENEIKIEEIELVRPAKGNITIAGVSMVQVEPNVLMYSVNGETLEDARNKSIYLFNDKVNHGLESQGYWVLSINAQAVERKEIQEPVALFSALKNKEV